MDVLSALLVDLIVIAVLFEIARRLNLPYPALFVLGGLALGFGWMSLALSWRWLSNPVLARK